jgi:hypothetical protein
MALNLTAPEVRHPYCGARLSEQDFSVQLVGSEAQIPPALWDACFAPPLEGRWWYQVLETCGLDDQFTFAYAVIYRGGDAVGIAPLFEMNVPLAIAVLPSLRPLIGALEKLLPSLFRPRTLFVGSPCADEGTVGLLPGVDRRGALACLQGALEAEVRRRGASMLIWKDFPQSFEDDLQWLAGQHRMFRMVSFPNTAMSFPTSRKEDYFAALKSSRRYKLKKKIHQSREKADLRVDVVQAPDERTIEEIFGLFRQTYERSATKFEKLNKRFFELIATKPTSHFVILREQRSGDMIAFRLCFDMGDHVINKFIGIDYSRPREWFLFFRLWDAGVDWALSRGATSVQSGQTAYGVKIEVGHKLVPLTNYGLHRNRLIHGIYRAVARQIRWQTLDDDLADFLRAHPDAGTAQ